MNEAAPTPSKEAILARLSEFDFLVAIDASGSMNTDDMPGGKTRWDYMQETLLDFTRDVCKIDSDGIGLIIFGNANVTAEDHCDVAKVTTTLASRHPRGDTPMTEGLQACLDMAKASDKKKIVLVFTDGEPANKATTEQLIINQANAQASDDALTFLFIQVGHDKESTKYLEHLDNGLTGAKFDIVCAKTIEEANKFDSTAELVAYAIDN